MAHRFEPETVLLLRILHAQIADKIRSQRHLFCFFISFTYS